MNYADIKLGTWYPDGGMYKIVDGMTNLAKSLGVKFHLNSEVTKINISNNKVSNFIVNDKAYEFDVVVGGADYHHIEQHLLEEKIPKV